MLTQKELAELLSVSRTTIGAWEKIQNEEWLKNLCVGICTSFAIPSLGLVQSLSGSQLIEVRSKHGWDQQALASRLSVSRSTISRWENGVPPNWAAYAVMSITFRENSDAYF
tara:strand:+ start:3896 stop:4231 length:336 start_codon:yes stop_codon:yes gene_type:complete